MKRRIASWASSALSASALVFVAVLKPLIHSPEAPEELQK